MTERDRDRPGEPIKGLPRRVRLPRAARSTDGAHWPTWRRLCGTDTADRRRDRWRTSVSATTKLMLGDAEVARIGLGANRLTNTPQHIALVKEAVVAGVNLIDTAHTYMRGESEETIGAALSPIPEVASWRRKEATLPGTAERRCFGRRSRRASEGWGPTAPTCTTCTVSTRRPRSRKVSARSRSTGTSGRSGTSAYLRAGSTRSSGGARWYP